MSPKADGCSRCRNGASLGRVAGAPCDSPLPTATLVYVFSHGQFIQAVRSLVVDTKLSDRDKMRKFWGKGTPAIANAERIELRTDDGVWWPTEAAISNGRFQPLR